MGAQIPRKTFAELHPGHPRSELKTDEDGRQFLHVYFAKGELDPGEDHGRRRAHGSFLEEGSYSEDNLRNTSKKNQQARQSHTKDKTTTDNKEEKHNNRKHLMDMFKVYHIFDMKSGCRQSDMDLHIVGRRGTDSL